MHFAGSGDLGALLAVPEPPVTPPPIPVSAHPARCQTPDTAEPPVDPGGAPHPPDPRRPAPPFAQDTAATGGLPAARPPGVPTIPTDTRPGWVFQDRGTGAYYAAVAQSRGGISLLALDDFTVARTAALVGPLELVGSVEATVWPLETGSNENGGVEAGSEAER